VQSDKPQVSGFVVREFFAEPSHPRSQMPLAAYFERFGIPAITGIDTRAITRKIRAHGSMKGIIVTNPERSDESALTELHSAPSMAGLDLVRKVSTLRPYGLEPRGNGPRRRIAVYDYGVKRDILHQLTLRGCDIVVYPAATHSDEIVNLKFDGVMLSNGPGDPEPVTYAQDNIRGLIGRIPIFGICLGHQLLGIALGGRTYKLKFGHHGGNHPVKDLSTGRVEITAQNHGFAVDPDSLNASEVEFTHVNLNDGTVEGFRHRSNPILAVQYHPEAAPGPHDSFHLFDEFLAMIDAHRK
jgi:carbamoyl-phosphate synthase small subunit